MRCALYVPNTLPLKLAALFHDLGKPATRTIDQNGTAHYYGHADISAQITDCILRRLKYSTAIREQVVTLVKAHMNMPPETKKAALKMLNNLGDSLSFDLLDLIAADRKATTGKYSGKETNAAKELISQQLALKQCFTLSSLNINGKDLISIGIPEGKEIGRILNALLSAVIDGKIQNEPAELIQAAKELIYT